jgi:hypothetical protein
MPIIALGTHQVYLQNPSVAAATNTTMDAANEAAIMIGQMWTSDGGSHTIDTTGSSKMSWRAGTSTFANAGTTVKVGLAAVSSGGTRPARAVNVANVITFDVSRTLTGGGGEITSGGYHNHVPDAGTKTIANGDLVAFCLQMTARAGVDSVLVSHCIHGNGLQRPGSTSYVGGTYAQANGVPNAIITFSDGARGYFYGGYACSLFGQAQLFGTGTAQVEYGNFIMSPIPLRVYGIMAVVDFDQAADMVLYSNPLVSPVAERSVVVDATQTQVNGSRWGQFFFSTPFDMAANQPYAITGKPTTATQITMVFTTFDSATHQEADHFGTNCYAISRASGGGAFSQINSGKDRFGMALLVSSFESGIGSSAPSYMLGM